MPARRKHNSVDFQKLQDLHLRYQAGDITAEKIIAPLIHEYGLAFGMKFFAFKQDQAQDFAQELYCAYKDHIAAIGNVRCWLLRVPLALAYDTLRKDYRWQRGKDISQASQYPPYSPEQQIIDRLEARTGLKLLRTRERSIVYWRIWRDLPFAEIAVKIKLEVDNVERIYHRALKRIAVQLAHGRP